MKLEVSTKHLKLRIALFVVLFLVIVTSFTMGILSLGNKTSGYQTIKADTDAEALTYNNWVTFKYYLEGSSNQIKRDIKQLQSIYTPILAAAYKQLDPITTYTGHVSLATINQNLGNVVSVSPQLYSILQDAYSRTLEKKGFNMFAGALYEEWKSILILEDPSEFDPLYNDYQASRIHAIADMVSDLSNFHLEFLDATTCSIRFDVSEAYKAFCQEYEIEAPALDLNVMTDAYRLSMMSRELGLAGCWSGYLSTPEGLAINMNTSSSLEYGLYTLENGSNEKYATLPLDGMFSAVTTVAYKNTSPYGYVLDDHYRNIWFKPETGDFADVLMSLSVISQDLDIVQNMYCALEMNQLDSEKAVQAYADKLKDSKIVSYILQSAN